MISTSQSIIEIRSVSKSFPLSYDIATWLRYVGRVPRRQALRDITLDVRAGELLALLGPNGAGKTTLLKLLATLSIPDTGSIRINGIDAAQHQLEVRAMIGLCPSEERSFYYRLTARQNLEFFGALAGLRRTTLRRRIQEATQSVNLDGVLDRRYDSFSSGVRQRLALARALLADPVILLLDEPTRAVDPLQALSIRKFIQEELVKRQGKTVILATNLLEEAWQLADRIAVIHDGSIGAIGPPQTLHESGAGIAVYEIVFDRPDPDLEVRLREIARFGTYDISAVNGTLTARVSVEASPAALTDLMRAISGAGSVRGFRPINPEPAHVFGQVIERVRKASS